MKAIKTIMAAVVAVAFALAASAQTVIHITGSTAYRGAVHQAIADILNAGYTVGYQGTTIGKASQAIFSGTTKVGGYSVIIKTSWSGSTAGVQAVSQQSPTVTIATWLQNGLTGSGLNSGPYDAAAPADCALSDSFQNSSRFTGTGYTQLHDTIVGVVPFVWVKGSSNDSGVAASLANLTNMTPQQAKLVLASGAPLSMFTGTTADDAIYVYPMGRDEDSGTRLCTFAESGFGIFSSPTQYQPTVAGGAITAIAAWPANTVVGFAYPVGHSGYSSGGTLATALNTPVASGTLDSFGDKIALIGYFGTSDAASVNGGANNLSYNGVPYSAAAIQEGKYTFWSYEHFVYTPTFAGTAKTVADQIANEILTTDATVSGILLSTMNVTRTVEGGVVIHN